MLEKNIDPQVIQNVIDRVKFDLPTILNYQDLQLHAITDEILKYDDVVDFWEEIIFPLYEEILVNLLWAVCPEVLTERDYL